MTSMISFLLCQYVPAESSLSKNAQMNIQLKILKVLKQYFGAS